MLEAVLAHIRDAVLVTRAEPVVGPEGPEVVFVNRAFETMTGWTAAEVVGRTPRLLQGPETDRAELDRIADALARWQPVDVTLLNRRKDGSPFWVDLSITPVADETGWFTHWVSVQREATARVLRQQRLEREHAFNRTVLDSLAASTCVVDADGMVTLTNRRWDEVARATGGDLTTTGIGSDYFATARLGAGGDRVVAGIEDVIAGRRPSYTDRVSCRARGTQRWFDLQAVPLQHAGTGAVVSHVDVTSTVASEQRLRRLLVEQSGLRALSTAIATEQPLEEIARIAISEVRELTGGTSASVVEYLGVDRARIVFGVGDEGTNPQPMGAVLELDPARPLAVLQRTGRAATLDCTVPGFQRSGYDPGFDWYVGQPVEVGGRVWGVLGAAGMAPVPDLEAALELIRPFAEVLSAGIDRHVARLALEEQAATDALTGLANHRTFQKRLREEVSRAQRHGRPLALALIDVDRFKSVNDHLGHERGDALLQAVARTLRDRIRAEDVLARIGGDEFALILPDTDGLTAFALIERARVAVAAHAFEADVAVTVSAGVCDLLAADEPGRLFELADGALYWSKAHGRDVTWLYDPTTVEQLSAQERAEHLERSRALSALRALARAIDAKDPSTRRHSERVAVLAVGLARELGWSSERRALLAEAALLHDVGKIGVRDAILLKPDRLDRSEAAEVREHARLGARIVEDVFTDEQVAWVLHHHERPDGTGYPDALIAQEIPQGAALIGLADAIDVMTVSRSYQDAKPPAEAVAEARQLAGVQFTEEAVAALEALLEAGELEAAMRGQVALPSGG